MFEGIVLGIIQGITEWLPVSSEGFLILAQVNLFDSTANLRDLIEVIIFLHLGTFFAALVYFRKDVAQLLKAAFRWKAADYETRQIFKFLVISTLITAIIAGGLLGVLEQAGENMVLNSKFINGFIGLLLLITAFLHLRVKKFGTRKEGQLNIKDSIWSGFAQGFTVLPGLSRSGLTVSTLLLRKFDDTSALRLSFLMSLPAVLGGNIFLQISGFVFKVEYLWGLFASFIFGLLTIHLLLKVAQRINFGYFVLGFGVLVLITIFI